jgi:hypothetical protein
MIIDKFVRLTSVIFILIFSMIFTFWGIFWAKWGVDLTDSGFFLYSQTRVLNRDVTDITPTLLWFGSDWLGAFWLSLNNDLNLHFARIGAFVLYGIVSIFVFLILLFHSKKVSVSIFITISSYLLFCSINIFPIIDYDSAPLLPLSLFFLLVVLNNKFSSNAILFLTGVVMFLIICFRVTLILLVSSYVAILFYYLGSYRWKKIVYFFYGAFFTVAVLLCFNLTRTTLLLSLETLLNTFYVFFINKNVVSSVTLFNSHNYSLTDQLYFWLRGYFRFLLLGLPILILFFINKYYKLAKVVFCLEFICLFFLLLTLLPFEKVNFLFAFSNIKSQIVYYYLYPAIIFFMGFVLYMYDKNNSKIILLLFATFILYPLGSNSFEKKITLTYPIIFPILTLLFYNFCKSTDSFSVVKLFNYFKVITLILFFQVVLNFDNFPYRDSQLSKLNGSFKTPGLRDIRSTQIRIDAIEPVVNKILSLKNEHSSLLALGSTNLFNFATNVKGVFDYPNPSYIDIRFVESKLNLFQRNHNLPEFIIYPLVDVTYDDWEMKRQPIDSERVFFNRVDHFIRSNNYKLIYKSPHFKIFRNSN